MIIISVSALFAAILCPLVGYALFQGILAGGREARKGLEWANDHFSPPAAFYRACGFKASQIPTYEKPKANHYYPWVGVQPVPPQPVAPNATTDPWVTYAMQHPEVKLQMVEKYDEKGDQFIAEKHLKMTGPVARPEVPPYDFNSRICYFPTKKTYSKLLANYNDLR